MANFKRKHRKQITVSTCGNRNCQFDKGRIFSSNGRDRYLSSYWKKYGVYKEKPWRYQNAIDSY